MIFKDSNNSFRVVRILISVAAIVIIIAGINLAQSIVVLFLVSVFLASPIVPLREFACLICLSMLTCAAATIFLVPGCVLRPRPTDGATILIGKN